MIKIRPAAERGQTKLGWLDSKHTFSFNRYHDPAHMGFRSLRVINDDLVAPGGGFGAHPHQDMEILSWVTDGALRHQDSTGGADVVMPGGLQYMSAGTGIVHSETNGSQTEAVRFLQIWILPDAQGHKPSYGQKQFPPEERLNRLRLIASGRPHDGAIELHQDANVYVATLEPGVEIAHPLATGRHAWVQVASGSLELNGQTLETGDGAAVSDESEVRLNAIAGSEVLVFDLA